MGVTVTIHNDVKFEVQVAIHLKGGVKLCSKILKPGEKWVKKDGGLSAQCPYDLRITKKGIGKRNIEWIFGMRAPPMQKSLDIFLSKVAVPERTKQRVPVGLGKKLHERAPIAAKWVSDESRNVCRHCDRPFSFIWRKHHCRICGDIFCDVCSRFKVLTALHPTMPARACFGCFEKHADVTSNPNLQPATPEGSRVGSALDLDDEGLDKKGGNANADADTPGAYLRGKTTARHLQGLVDEIGFGGVLAACLFAWLSSLLGLYLWIRKWNLLQTSDEISTSSLLVWGVATFTLFTVAMLLLVVAAYKGYQKWNGVKVPLLSWLSMKPKQESLAREEMKTAQKMSESADSGDQKETKEFTAEESKFVVAGEHACSDLWEWTTSHHGWTQKRAGDVQVWIRNKAVGGVKAFKAVGRVNVSAQKMFKLISDVQLTTKWNKALREYSVLRKLSSEVDLTYALGAPTGPISARDFVQVRIVRAMPPSSASPALLELSKPQILMESDSEGEEDTRPGTERNVTESKELDVQDGKKTAVGNDMSRHRGYIVGGCSIEGGLVAPRSGVVRGYNYPCGYVILEGKGDEDKSCSSADRDHWCRLVWIVNTDLKGWLPASIVATTLTGIMVKFYETDLKSGLQLLEDDSPSSDDQRELGFEKHEAEKKNTTSTWPRAKSLSPTEGKSRQRPVDFSWESSSSRDGRVCQSTPVSPGDDPNEDRIRVQYDRSRTSPLTYIEDEKKDRRQAAALSVAANCESQTRRRNTNRLETLRTKIRAKSR
eukprot:CAMPEP_0114505644 /NCGR_PEP_ID=MMETSP0109-20121206/10969_1 /TAXON_ID=29199 /ORGANISM="Chlorarachnion reptans, Strain CCCM449" /LENGTH=768 /DNA_ID=CAMNT_0001684109 /DNA_START=176 /DNA_END=2482 /DNA_ORIENTATION=+